MAFYRNCKLLHQCYMTLNLKMFYDFISHPFLLRTVLDLRVTDESTLDVPDALQL